MRSEKLYETTQSYVGEMHVAHLYEARPASYFEEARAPSIGAE